MPLSWENSNPARSRLDNLQSTTLSISLAFPWIPEQKRSIFVVVVTKNQEASASGRNAESSSCRWKDLLILQWWQCFITAGTYSPVFLGGRRVFARLSSCNQSTYSGGPPGIDLHKRNKKPWAGAPCLHPIDSAWVAQTEVRPLAFQVLPPLRILTRWMCKEKKSTGLGSCQSCTPGSENSWAWTERWDLSDSFPL